MIVKAESYGHAVVLNCKGELTADGLEAFSSEVGKHVAESVTDLVFNFSETPFVDSAALEYLLDLQESLAEKLGQITLTNLDESVAKILEMTRLESSFTICKDVVDAVRTV